MARRILTAVTTRAAGITPFERAERDPAFLERFARAYRGGADPLDALWWLDHPAEPGPSGAPPAAGRMTELRRAVYAPGADPAAAERYRELRSSLEGERAAVRAALAEAEGRDEHEPQASADAPTATALERPPRPSRPLLAVAVGVSAVAAFAAGLLSAPAIGGGGAPPPSSTATPRSTPTPADTAPFVSGASGSGSALGIFGEPQRDADRPAVGLGARLLPQTFHRLQAVPTFGVDVYAAEDSEGDVCLVALSVEAHLTASCTPIAAFRAAPLRLAFRADRYRDVWTKTGEQVELVATWGFFSRFTLDETALVAKQ
jgi:hypothetical protein